MTERISLVEAYDNRDVIARLVRQQADIDMMMNILQNVDPDGDLTNVVLRTGDQTIAGRKTFTGEIVADCDIIQNGAAYETHAEQIFSHNDYLVMRDGQLNGLPAGSYSGLQVKKYNGSDDVRMVVDNTGIMRVGDINDERPLAVRDEAADMTSGALVRWDGVNQKIITSSANIGDDTSPVKIVGGEPVAVSGALQPALLRIPLVDSGGVKVSRYGQLVFVSFVAYNHGDTSTHTVVSGLPKAAQYAVGAFGDNVSQYAGSAWIAENSTSLQAKQLSATNVWASFVYITSE